MPTDYIERRLHLGVEIISEEACLAKGGIVVVLAEPGAGKTELLKSFARRLGVKHYRASLFRHASAVPQAVPLVIDALDEVARQDQSAVDAILVKAQELGAPTAIFSSRSSEWDNERTRLVEECAGTKPSVVYLGPFDHEEQKVLFEVDYPGEDFEAFHAEADRFELTPVLGNPMFLTLFVEGYLQGGKQFHSKRRIFKDAIDRLAGGDRKGRRPDAAVAIPEIVDSASELFAKLLLSGASGVATVERLNDCNYPHLPAMSKREWAKLKAPLDSRLFKPSADADCHDPVHRIVAEYCAAHYLAKRLSDPADHFSLRRCFALIAPNGVVRDELRGLVGWLAALGDKRLQSEAIQLDPYAILANGDPSQLDAASKKTLFRKMKELSAVDPYFRRSDIWRQFNAAGFFTIDVADEVKQILNCSPDPSHLLNLTLELLHEAEIVKEFASELRTLVLDPDSGLTTRLLACRCLLRVQDYDPCDDFRKLLSEESVAACNVASEFVIGASVPRIAKELLLELLKRLGMAANTNERRRSEPGVRSFIRALVRSLELDETVWLLDNLTPAITCSCGANKHYECRCRSDISKLVGRLLDRYFELSPGKHDPVRLWTWTRNLKFPRDASAQNSIAVKALEEDAGLRREIHLLAFDGQKDRDKLLQTLCDLRWSEWHAGLRFGPGDAEAVCNHAFATDNPVLWIHLAPNHYPHDRDHVHDEFRARLKAQARLKPGFMKEWARSERSWREACRKTHYSPRRRNRFERRKEAILASNRAHLRENLAQIEQGNHWGWNRAFAQRYLHSIETLGEIVDDSRIAESALANCFPFLTPQTPGLIDLANGRGGDIAEVLHAGCLVRFRRGETLADLGRDVLLAVRTETGSAKTYRDGEAKRFEAALDALIFQSSSDIEEFARQFIEPTIAGSEGVSTNVWWLESRDSLSPVRAKLASEWLEKYTAASLHAIDTLFDICAQSCDRSWLLSLINERCNRHKAAGNGTSEDGLRRTFWSLRHFYFSPEDREEIWSAFLSDPENIFGLEHISGSLRGEGSRGWPPLTSEKLFRILDAYVEVWPKVYLPSSWGTGSPREETAYRFLTDIFWHFDQCPPQESIPVINRMLADTRFSTFHVGLRSLRAAALRKRALHEFALPSLADVVDLLDSDGVCSVETLRALVMEELESVQQWIDGTSTDPVKMFWNNGVRVDENTARNRIVERLQGRIQALNASVVIEHHMAKERRCDFTVTSMIGGHRHLLVCEVKGQWHPELYTAAAEQLDKRYAIHPDAAQQGIFLALWVGADENVAARRNHGISTPDELRAAILAAMPDDLHGFVDVFVLDISV